jgi:hypothetical protein
LPEANERPEIGVLASDVQVGIAFRRRLSQAMGLVGLLGPLGAKADRAGFVRDVRRLGVDFAVAACAEKARTYRGAKPIGGLDFFADYLRELPTPASDDVDQALAVREAECALWGAILRDARDSGMPLGYLRYLLDVPAARDASGALRLLPPTPELAEVLRTHLDAIRRAAAEREGRDVDVFVEEPRSVAGASA